MNYELKELKSYSATAENSDALSGGAEKKTMGEKVPVYRTAGSRNDKSSASQIRFGHDSKNMVYDSAGASRAFAKSYFANVLGGTGKSQCRGTTW